MRLFGKDEPPSNRQVLQSRRWENVLAPASSDPLNARPLAKRAVRKHLSILAPQARKRTGGVNREETKCDIMKLFF